MEKKTFVGRLYYTEKALWKFSWFLRDFGYDAEMLSHDQVDVKALVNLQGVVCTSHSVINGRSYQNLDGFAPAGEWETLSCASANVTEGGKPGVNFSFTQISNYLRCPRSYRHRYLDGWRVKETQAGMVFGRCFGKALASLFLQEDCAATLFQEWGAFRDASLEYKKGESWDRLVHQGVRLLEHFARDNRVHIQAPKQNLQIKMLRALPGGHEFIAYLDAIGQLDGQPCVDRKRTTSRYAAAPGGLLSLDPQLICYSWISGIPEVALVVFVRKQVPEIQYLTASITEKQRQEFGQLVETTIEQITAGEFPAHSGIRFPQNGCVSCANLGLCLNNQPLIDANALQKPTGGHRTGPRNRGLDVGFRQIPWLLSRDDLRRLFGWRQFAGRRSQSAAPGSSSTGRHAPTEQRAQVLQRVGATT